MAAASTPSGSASSTRISKSSFERAKSRWALFGKAAPSQCGFERPRECQDDRILAPPADDLNADGKSVAAEARRNADRRLTRHIERRGESAELRGAREYLGR